MNQDHYEKARRGCQATSESIALRISDPRYPAGLLDQINEWWKAEWGGQPSSVLDLSGANLEGKSIAFSLNDANLRGAVLSRAAVLGSAEGADFTGAELIGCTMYLRCKGAIFRDCNFSACSAEFGGFGVNRLHRSDILQHCSQ